MRLCINFGFSDSSRYRIDSWKEIYLPQNPQKQVVQTKQRNYAVSVAKFWLGKDAPMPKQAKTLTQPELRRVLDYIATRPHAARNRAMLLCTFLGGLRVGEVASLRYADVMDGIGNVRDEIQLLPEQTKGRHGRVVFVSTKLKRELEHYLKSHPATKPEDRLFYTQKKLEQGFTPNTLAQHFHYLYKGAEIFGASSHSGRRTFATQIASRGVSVRVLMRALGHRQLSTVMQYIDASDDMLRKAVELA
jgi:integrase/recombinase XerD